MLQRIFYMMVTWFHSEGGNLREALGKQAACSIPCFLQQSRVQSCTITISFDDKKGDIQSPSRKFTQRNMIVWKTKLSKAAMWLIELKQSLFQYLSNCEYEIVEGNVKS